LWRLHVTVHQSRKHPQTKASTVARPVTTHSVAKCILTTLKKVSVSKVMGPPCCGYRFFTDAYDLYMVGVITPMIAFARFPDHVKGGNLGSLPDQYDLVVKGMALVGTLVGQVRVCGCVWL